MSARELGVLARTSHSLVRLIEARDGITVDTAIKIAGVFDVSLDWLLTGVGPEPKPSRVLVAVRPALSALRSRTKKKTGTSG